MTNCDCDLACWSPTTVPLHYSSCFVCLLLYCRVRDHMRPAMFKHTSMRYTNENFWCFRGEIFFRRQCACACGYSLYQASTVYNILATRRYKNLDCKQKNVCRPRCLEHGSRTFEEDGRCVAATVEVPPFIVCVHLYFGVTS